MFPKDISPSPSVPQSRGFARKRWLGYSRTVPKVVAPPPLLQKWAAAPGVGRRTHPNLPHPALEQRRFVCASGSAGTATATAAAAAGSITTNHSWFCVLILELLRPSVRPETRLRSGDLCN